MSYRDRRPAPAPGTITNAPPITHQRPRGGMLRWGQIRSNSSLPSDTGYDMLFPSDHEPGVMTAGPVLAHVGQSAQDAIERLLNDNPQARLARPEDFAPAPTPTPTAGSTPNH